uniref:Uncharacterized protein n=1 Tax=Romanomermis culicivorax TaxID=13658 RepID=A0A915L639_ROMCU
MPRITAVGPTTWNAASAMDKINVVETRAKTRQKLATMPQTDLEVPERLEEEKIVDPADLPNQYQWPFMQQQIADAQKVDPMLDQTRRKVENQLKRSSEGDNITIDKRYQEDCWFLETTPCKWENLCLRDPFLLTNYDGNEHFPQLLHLEKLDVDIYMATQQKLTRKLNRRQDVSLVKRVIVGTELSSQDVCGQQTTTPSSEQAEPQMMLMQPKSEATKDIEEAEKLTRIIVEETPPPPITATVSQPTARVEESEESDYVVEVEGEISSISDEEVPMQQRPQRINHPQIQSTMAKSSLMEIERNMIIIASFGTIRPTAAPQSSPSASICLTDTQPFQPSQAAPTSTGVWMPI